MRIIAVIAALFVLAAGPALAQDAPDAARQSHLELAGRYLELTQGGDLLKQMRGQIEEGYGQSSLPPEQRAWMVERFSAMFSEVMRAMLVELRDDVADRFTVEELETAIAFYGSPTGRAVVRKQVDLNSEMQRVMMPLLVPRMTEMMEKFCLRFDCAALGAAAAKQGR